MTLRRNRLYLSIDQGNGTSQGLLSDDRHHEETDPLIPSSPTAPSKPSGRLVFKVAAAMFSFCVLGLLNSTIGVILPHLETHYNLSDAQVSFVFIAWPIGYVLAASFNDIIHIKLGQRGIALIGSLTQIISAIGCAAHPSFPWFLLFIAFGFFGCGILDGSMCAWAGALERASMVTGFLHGSFSVGAALSPVLVDALVSEGSRPWYTWYYVMLGASILELIVLVFAFRHDDGPAYNEEKRRNQEQSSPSSGFGVVVLKYAAVWLCSLYLLAYVGTETSISGWVIIFMQRVRHSSSFVASLCSSGFWTGMAVGRISLGALSDRFGVKTSVTVYTSFTLLFAILFGVSQNDAMSVSTISLLGLFCGPLFPSSIVLLTAALPSELHVPGVSFVASVGQVGGTLMPFGIGLIVDAVGMAAFQAIFLIQLVVSLFLWVLYSRLVS